LLQTWLNSAAMIATKVDPANREKLLNTGPLCEYLEGSGPLARLSRLDGS